VKCQESPRVHAGEYVNYHTVSHPQNFAGGGGDNWDSFCHCFGVGNAEVRTIVAVVGLASAPKINGGWARIAIEILQNKAIFAQGTVDGLTKLWDVGLLSYCGGD